MERVFFAYNKQAAARTGLQKAQERGATVNFSSMTAHYDDGRQEFHREVYKSNEIQGLRLTNFHLCGEFSTEIVDTLRAQVR